MGQRNLFFYFLLVASLVAYIVLGYCTVRADFTQVITLYAWLFGMYSLLLRKSWVENHFPTLLVAALLYRLALLLMLPNLSDDYFRFVWDGRLLSHGHNPYLVLPSEYVQTTPAAQAGLTKALFTQLNSPDYYTVYPPVNQWIFALATSLFPHSLWGSVVVMRLFLLLAEVGTVALLLSLTRRLQLPRSRLLLYALNPLIINELTGNLHFEALMLFFLLGAFYWLTSDRFHPSVKLLLSAGCLALSVAVKLIPLLLLPLLGKRLGFWRGLLYYSCVGLFVWLLFSPFINEQLVARFFSSLDLYFRKFEFNASIYYLARALGYRLLDTNLIVFFGPFLLVIALMGILEISFSAGRLPRLGQAATFAAAYLSLARAVLFCMTLYFVLATTVHPWYVSTLLLLSVLTPYRFPVVWSALVPLTYFAYRTAAYDENLGLVALEYALVLGWLFYELVRHQRAHTQPTDPIGEPAWPNPTEPAP